LADLAFNGVALFLVIDALLPPVTEIEIYRERKPFGLGHQTQRCIAPCHEQST